MSNVSEAYLSHQPSVPRISEFDKKRMSELAPLGILIPARRRRPLISPFVFKSKLASMEDNQRVSPSLTRW